jgi:polysaccharide biosynthesis/export protein
MALLTNYRRFKKKMSRVILIIVFAGLFGVFYHTALWAGNSAVTTPGANSAANLNNEGNYVIGPGDLIDISVWRDEALSRSCIVRPDGFISFPLTGEIMAAGRTASQLKSEMESRLSRYVPDLTLSLEIKQINSLIIYVLGKVNNPGRFILNADTNVLQALATAGGLNIFADSRGIRIFRQGTNETIVYPFDYDEVVRGKRLEQNIYLKRGDVVVIP